MKKETEEIIQKVTAEKDSHNKYNADNMAAFAAAVVNDVDYTVEKATIKANEVASTEQIVPAKAFKNSVKNFVKKATGMDEEDAKKIEESDITKKDMRPIVDAVQAVQLEYMKMGNTLKFPTQHDNAVEIQLDKMPAKEEERTVYEIPKEKGAPRVPIRDEIVTTEERYVAKIKHTTPSFLKKAKTKKVY